MEMPGTEEDAMREAGNRVVGGPAPVGLGVTSVPEKRPGPPL